MIHSIASARAASLLGLAIAASALLGLAGCGRSEQKPDDQVEVEVAHADTDPGFLRAMLRDEVSTRDASRPGSRFVLSENADASGRYSSARRSSDLIDTATGCAFRVYYLSESSSEIPGAPGAGGSILSPNPPPQFSLRARGSECARVPLRPDLARARDIAAARKPGSLAFHRAFAAALPEIRSAIGAGSKAAPDARFAEIARAEGSSRDPHTLHTLLERATGCQWKARLSPDGMLSPASLEPDSCLNAYAAPAASSIAAASGPSAR